MGGGDQAGHIEGELRESDIGPLGWYFLNDQGASSKLYPGITWQTLGCVLMLLGRCTSTIAKRMLE